MSCIYMLVVVHVDGARLCLWTAVSNGPISYPPVDIWEWRATVKWHWQEKTEELGEESVPVPLCQPQIRHGLTRARTRVSALGGRPAWAMARPICWLAIICSNRFWTLWDNVYDYVITTLDFPVVVENRFTGNEYHCHRALENQDIVTSAWIDWVLDSAVLSRNSTKLGPFHVGDVYVGEWGTNTFVGINVR
jgi:hypothetical protein